MRLVLLTGEDHEHCHVANRLADAFALARIVVDAGVPRSRLNRVRYLRRRYSTAQLLSRAIGQGLAFVCRDRAARREALFQVLGREPCERHRHQEILTRVSGLNAPATQALIRDLSPDVLLVYGTAVVRDEILSLAARLALNLHTGMSPYYRGVDCAFWPLYHGELERLGATVHQCTRELDGGVIYQVGQVPLERDDDRFRVFARAVKLGTDLYVQAVRELLEGRLQGQPQQLELGYEYRAAMKEWRHELAVRWRIRRGLIRNYAARHQGVGSEPGEPHVI